MHTSIRLDTPIELINITPLNPLISKCQIKVCYVGDTPNRNKSIITKDVARQLANSLPGSPIVGYFNNSKEDFEEHNRMISISNGRFEIKDNTRPYGFVDLGAKVWFAKYLDDNQVEREYLVTEGYLWTGQYPECERAVAQGNNQSMELDEKTINAFWTRTDNEKPQFFIINEAIISKLCILGEDQEPCFEGANITAPTIQFSFSDDFKEQLFSMMNELKDLLSKGGEKKLFTRYSVEIGDSLWEALFAHKETSYSEYTIEGVYEEEGQKFSVLTSNDKYYRLDFSAMEDGTYTFAAELSELESYVPAEEPQFSADDITAYIEKKKEGKSGQDNSDENQNNVKDSEEEKCPKCNKPVSECVCEEEKKDKYILSEIPEYVELKNSFDTLTENFNLVSEQKGELEKKVAELVAFKTQVERKEKEEMIASFCMLSDADKADVVANIDTYSLNDIEAKLSVICFRNKINFSLDTDIQKEPIVVNLEGNADEDAMTPAWVKAAIQVAKKMN